MPSEEQNRVSSVEKCVESYKELCFVCFDSLLAHFTGKELPKSSSTLHPDYTCPLFVTWEKSASGVTTLRGCIGTLTPTRLCESLAEYALHSAFRDSRFPSIEPHELSSLFCKLSLLHSSECATNYLDWTIGVHGLRIEFVACDTSGDSNSTFTATYLPEIPLQECWTKEETIQSLIRKSGYRGDITDQLKSSMKITRYQSSVSTASYEEYTRARISS